MFLPDEWPSYYSRAEGSRIWDLDGRCFLDMSYSGIGACVLGYADPDVNRAVCATVSAGSMTTLNCPEEIELADLLCEIHPWADMARFTRSGGEAMAVAIRISRAHSGRDKIAFCGYHGWHDWYLAANLASADHLEGHLLPGLDPAGVPKNLAGTAMPFHYNCPEELEAIVHVHGSELAAVVMEPMRSQRPRDGFLHRVKELARDCGAVLVFDEITAGWRMNSGGLHLLQGVDPDVAVFAKAIANGFPMGAVIGTATVMQAAQSTFISSTAWTERTGPAAALATIRKHRALNVSERLIASGRKIQDIWSRAAASAGLPITVSGLPPLSHFQFDLPDAQACRTLFTQYMLERGFLATNAFYANFAQTEQDIASLRRSYDRRLRGASSGRRRRDSSKPLERSCSAHRLFSPDLKIYNMTIEKRRLGKTEIFVPRLGLGCATFGREIDEQTSFALMDYAVQHGITLFDTAEAYGGGQAREARKKRFGIDEEREVSGEFHSSEKIVGRWLQSREARADIVLVSKITTDLTADHIRTALDATLERLQTDFLDAYLFHRYDPVVPLAESMAAMYGARQSGRIRTAGCSNFTLAQLTESEEVSKRDGVGRLEVSETIFNMIDRGAEDDILPFCRNQEMGFFGYSPLAAGFLTGKYLGMDRVRGSRFDVIPDYNNLYAGPEKSAVVSELLDLSQRMAIPAPQLATAWVLSHPDVTTVLVGARSIQHLQNALAALDLAESKRLPRLTFA